MAGDGIKLGTLLAHVLGMRCFLWDGSYCPSLGQKSTSIGRTSPSACSCHCNAGQGLLLCSDQGNLSWPAQSAGVKLFPHQRLTVWQGAGSAVRGPSQQAPCIPAPPSAWAVSVLLAKASSAACTTLVSSSEWTGGTGASSPSISMFDPSLQSKAQCLLQCSG